VTVPHFVDLAYICVVLLLLNYSFLQKIVSFIIFLDPPPILSVIIIDFYVAKVKENLK
jgi:purine-cytosine permease-like protein